jgi:hypothetical protein
MADRWEVSRILADSIRAELKRSKETQKQLADLLGIPKWTMAKRLSGVHQFYPYELVTVAEHFGVHVGTLFDEVEDDEEVE